MLRVNELVEMSVSQTGEPVGFTWRGDSYLVVSRPIRWFARREWWTESPRAYRGIGAEVIETEMWRLNAGVKSKSGLASSQSSAQFELVHSAVSNRWKLVRVFA